MLANTTLEKLREMKMTVMASHFNKQMANHCCQFKRYTPMKNVCSKSFFCKISFDKTSNFPYIKIAHGLRTLFDNGSERNDDRKLKNYYTKEIGHGYRKYQQVDRNVLG